MPFFLLYNSDCHRDITRLYWWSVSHAQGSSMYMHVLSPGSSLMLYARFFIDGYTVVCMWMSIKMNLQILYISVN